MTTSGALRALALGAAAAAAVAVPAAPASAGTDTLVFEPDADTYADAARPLSTFAGSTGMWVDGDPRREAFLRFWTPGIAGREVTGVRLRLVQRDASPAGGRVHAITASGWPEALTWSGRPALDGPLLGSFGAVEAGRAYTLPLDGAAVPDGGLLALGIDSRSSDGARWAASEGSAPPRLEVDVASPAGFVADGLSLVAGPKAGSSDPTALATNRRLALTRGGRLLALHGRHSDGVRLAWRDPSGGWGSATTGATSSGRLLGGTGTGDWSASLVVGDDGTGAEVAWVVMSGPNSSAGRSLLLRRVTDLDAPSGPRVRSLVTLDAPAGGAYRADVALERRPDGRALVVVVWTRRVDETTFELVLGRFDARSSTPAITEARVLVRGTAAARWGTLVPTPSGTALVARASASALTLFGGAAGAPLDAWARLGVGPVVDVRAAPSAVALPDGDVLTAVVADASARTTEVLRFPAAGGGPLAELSVGGLVQPTIAAQGQRAVVVGVDADTGHLVSRERNPNGVWGTTRTEVGANARARVKHPNALRETDDRLRVVAEGPDGSLHRSAVVAFQRPL